MPRDDPVTTATIIFVHAGHYRGLRGQFGSSGDRGHIEEARPSLSSSNRADAHGQKTQQEKDKEEQRSSQRKVLLVVISKTAQGHRGRFLAQATLHEDTSEKVDFRVQWFDGSGPSGRVRFVLSKEIRPSRLRIGGVKAEG